MQVKQQNKSWKSKNLLINIFDDYIYAHPWMEKIGTVHLNDVHQYCQLKFFHIWLYPMHGTADRKAHKFVLLLSANHIFVMCPVDQWECSHFVALTLSAFLGTFPWSNVPSKSSHTCICHCFSYKNDEKMLKN